MLRQMRKIISLYKLIKFCSTQAQLTSNCNILNRKVVKKSTLIEAKSTNQPTLTVMQWNILAQALAYNYDKFSTCSKEDLDWSKRRWKIILEIAQYMPLDIICLQEVDQFNFIKNVLKSIGFEGEFFPKPDSPCYHISCNSGPDGCAIFYNSAKYFLLSTDSRVIKVDNIPSNQVILNCKFKCKLTSRIFCVATTHLKARKGYLLSCYRNEQGKYIVDYLLRQNGFLPTIVTGDFNAEPNEPVYKTITERYASSYSQVLLSEPSYTNWTCRQDEEEVKQTLDYIFYNEKFTTASILDTYCDQKTGPFPNRIYPSDHLSLVAKFIFI